MNKLAQISVGAFLGVGSVALGTMPGTVGFEFLVTVAVVWGCVVFCITYIMVEE